MMYVYVLKIYYIRTHLILNIYIYIYIYIYVSLNKIIYMLPSLLKSSGSVPGLQPHFRIIHSMFKLEKESLGKNNRAEAMKFVEETC